MTNPRSMGKIGSAAFALALLAACGGSDAAPAGVGTGAGPTSAPAPSPTPTSTSTSSPFQISVDKSPFALGQTQAQSFAVLGFVQTGADGSFEYLVDPASLDTTVPVGFRLAGQADLRFALPNLGEDTIKANGGGGYTSGGQIVSLGFGALGGSGYLNVAYGPEAKPLASVAHGFWTRIARPSTKYYLDLVTFLYGIPTASSAVPLAGTFEYLSCCKDQSFTAITADFAAGRLTGSIPLEGNAALTLSDVTIGADRSTFAGKVAGPGIAGEGTIEGRFAGPAANEIMARVVFPVTGGRAGRLVAVTRLPAS